MKQQEYAEMQTIYENEGQAAITAIATVLRGINYIDQSTLVATAYVLYKAQSSEVRLNTFEDFCDSINADENRAAFLSCHIGDVWQMVSGQRYRYKENVLKSLILFYEDREYRFGPDGKTPASISKLACKIFNYDDNETVADFGIGSASFTIESYFKNPSLNFYGIECNATIKEIASIRLEILGINYSIEHGDILDLDSASHQYKYIFANYPFGLKLRDIGFDRNKMLQRILQKTPEFSKSISSDWFFNAAIVECLSEGGRGIAIMTNGSTWNTLDKSARKFFIESGYIEAVIALPEKMFENFNIPTTMIVISRNNDKTMLVDATGLCEKGRRFNSFTEEQINNISFAVSNETSYSRFVSRQEMMENDYVINPTRYLTEEIVIENGKQFASIIKTITRGAPLKANELDELVSDTPTDIQYIMLSNIQKGQISLDLPYLKSIQDNLRKYCLKNHSLILSKNGMPLKVAVAEVKPGQTILANGNLYIIEIDEEKADPYYVKAFLESEKGIALLKSITVGATIPNIGVESLKKIPIPMIPIDEQKKIASSYLAKIDEIKIYQRKLEKAYEELSHIYDSKE